MFITIATTEADKAIALSDFLRIMGIYPPKGANRGDSCQFCVSFDHFTSSDFNVWLWSWRWFASREMLLNISFCLQIINIKREWLCELRKRDNVTPPIFDAVLYVGQRPVRLLRGWVAPGTWDLRFRHESDLPACQTRRLNPGHHGTRQYIKKWLSMLAISVKNTKHLLLL